MLLSKHYGEVFKQKKASESETFCSPYEIRTRITTVKGWCPSP